jgi:DoxX-like family
MELLVFYLEGALALFFFAAGASKLFWSREALASVLPNAEGFSDSGFRALGAVELVASLGLVFPIFIGGMGLLAPVSAGVLVVLQSWMGVLHWRRTSNGAFAILTVLTVLGLLFVIWGRLGPYPL